MAKSAYAIIQTGGKQYRVKAGDIIDIELLKGDQGSEVTFSDVLLVRDEKETKVGSPTVGGYTVVGKLLGETVGKKLNCMTFKKRCNQRRRYGHRQGYTRVEITDIKAQN